VLIAERAVQVDKARSRPASIPPSSVLPAVSDEWI
jgi:hypothetical protein